MKINIKIILILITCFSTNLYSQKLDSIILKNNNPKVENPKIKSLDSVRTKFNNSLNNLSDKGYLVSTNEYNAPNFFYTQNDGKEITLNDYFYKELKKISTKFKAYFKIEIDWNGQINFVKLAGYQGDIRNIDFVTLWKGIKAKPATEFGIPIKTLVTIPIIKN